MGAFDSILAGGKNAYGLLTTTGVVNVSASLPPTAGQILVANSSNDATWQNAPSGGTPGGADTQLQFNDAGAFGGAAGVVYDKVSNSFQVTGEFLSPGGGLSSTKIGQSAVSSGIQTISIGDNSSIVADYSLGVGNGATIPSLHTSCIAIGDGATIADSLTPYNVGAIAIGANASIGTDATASCTGGIVIGNNAYLSKNSSGSICIGDGAYTYDNGLDSICIGRNSRAWSSNNIVIGSSAYISSFTGYSVVIGSLAKAYSARSIAIGYNSKGTYNSVAIGYGSSSDGVAIGYNATNNGQASSVSVGSSSSSRYGCTAVGHYAQATPSSGFGVALGYAARAFGEGCIQIGGHVNLITQSDGVFSISLLGYIYAGCDKSIAIGSNSRIGSISTPSTNCISLGNDNKNYDNYSICIGDKVQVDYPRSIGIGYYAYPTTQDQCVIGSKEYPLDVVSHKSFGVAGILNYDTITINVGDTLVIGGGPRGVICSSSLAQRGVLCAGGGASPKVDFLTGSGASTGGTDFTDSTAPFSNVSKGKYVRITNSALGNNGVYKIFDYVNTSTVILDATTNLVAETGLNWELLEPLIVTQIGLSQVYVEPNTVVNYGDTLVSSNTACTATVDNTVTDPSKILGYCWESKTTGVARELVSYQVS